MYIKLETLRGISACMVVLFHSPFSFSASNFNIINNSYLFVDFFFLLSGFVMTFSYREKIREGMELKKFILLRLGRLYPLHVFMLAVLVVYIGFKYILYSIGFGGEQEFDKNNALSLFTNLILIHSLGVHEYLTWNTPSWSISVEFFTYILFFYFVTYAPHRFFLLAAMAFSVWGYFWLFNLDRGTLDITYDYGFIRCVSGFFLGSVIFHIREKFPYNLPINFSEGVSFTLVVVLLLLPSGQTFLPYMAIVSFTMLLFVFADNTHGFIGGVLKLNVLRSVGIWSYSIYMIHMFVFSIVTLIFEYILNVPINSITSTNSILINTAILIVVITLSKFSYFHIENRFREKIKQKIQNLSQ